jgi:hypothetical protein
MQISYIPVSMDKKFPLLFRQFQDARRNSPLRHILPIADDQPPPYISRQSDSGNNCRHPARCRHEETTTFKHISIVSQPTSSVTKVCLLRNSPLSCNFLFWERRQKTRNVMPFCVLGMYGKPTTFKDICFRNYIFDILYKPCVNLSCDFPPHFPGFHHHAATSMYYSTTL